MQSEIENIKEYASLFLSVDEIAKMIGEDVNILRREIADNKTERAKAYWQGKLQTQIELRKQTLQFAIKGSPQAETEMLNFLKKQNTSENA